MKATPSSVAIIAASVLLCGGAAEALVRVVAPQDARIQTPEMYQRDSILSYRLTPSHTGVFSNRVEYRTTVRTDERGLRIPAGAAGARADARRVLMLGDSFVFGQGVDAEDALPLQIEQALAQRGDSVSVLNGGVVGYSTVQELAWFERIGGSLKPDVVIVGFFLGNDLQDNRTSSLERFVRGVITAPPSRWYSPATEWAYRHSELYDLVRKVPETWADRRRNGPNAVVTGYSRKYLPPDDSVYRQEIAITASALGGLADHARGVGARLFVVLIPEAIQVERARQGKLLRIATDSVHFDFDHPNHDVARRLDSIGVGWLDLTPTLRAAAARGAALYYPIDGHWTRAGNTLAAQTIADALVRHRLIPGSAVP